MKVNYNSFEIVRKSNTLITKGERAITLIALVITILVLIIIATIVISLSLNNNGILNRAMVATKGYSNEHDYEVKSMDTMTNSIENFADNGSVQQTDGNGPILQAVGNATSEDVLDGKIFSSSTEIGAEGSMPNNGAWNATINPGAEVTIPEGYHDGSGKVTANNSTIGVTAIVRNSGNVANTSATTVSVTGLTVGKRYLFVCFRAYTGGSNAFMRNDVACYACTFTNTQSCTRVHSSYNNYIIKPSATSVTASFPAFSDSRYSGYGAGAYVMVFSI